MKKKLKKRRPFAEQENPHKLVRKMAKDHTDVLQNIEFALVIQPGVNIQTSMTGWSHRH